MRRRASVNKFVGVGEYKKASCDDRRIAAFFDRRRQKSLYLFALAMMTTQKTLALLFAALVALLAANSATAFHSRYFDDYDDGDWQVFEGGDLRLCTRREVNASLAFQVPVLSRRRLQSLFLRCARIHELRRLCRRRRRWRRLPSAHVLRQEMRLQTARLCRQFARPKLSARPLHSIKRNCFLWHFAIINAIEYVRARACAKLETRRSAQ